MAFRRVRIRKILIPMLVILSENYRNLAKTATWSGGKDRLPNQNGTVASGSLKGKGERRKEKMKDPKPLLPALQEFLDGPGINRQTPQIPSKPDLYRALRIWLKHKRGNLRSLELNIEALERLV